MLRFFNRIRKQLAKENRFFQYSRYAIGEILLVVIGILIALQIDNWNNTREEKRVEEDLLLGLQNNLQMNINKLEKLIDGNLYGINRLNRIRTIIDDETEPIDTIGNLYQLAFLTQNIDLPLNSYKALENRGFEIIRNKSLRDSVIKYFENGYAGMQGAQNYSDEINKRTQDFMYDNLIQVGGGPDENGRIRIVMEPLHSNEIWKSKDFYKILNAKHLQRNWINEQCQLFLEKTIQLDSLIIMELKAR